MYLHALFVLVAARVVVQALGMHWSALIDVEPFRELASLGEGGLVLAQFLAMVAVYCAAFVGIALIVSLIGTLRDDPDLLERVARWPAWWATTARRDLIWGGTRPYAWAALILPTPILMVVHYRITRTYNTHDSYFGELIALIVLTGATAAQTLQPFDWSMKVIAALSRMPQRVGLSSIQQAPPGDVQRAADPVPAVPRAGDGA